MLKISCPDGIDLKFMDERDLDVTVEEGELTVKDSRTKEVLIRLDEGKWSNFVSTPNEYYTAPPNYDIRITG